MIRLRLDFLREIGEVEGRVSPAGLELTTRDYVNRTLKTGQLSVWLAEENGASLGCCALILFDRPPSYGNPSGLTGYLINVYTLPAHRRRGIAARLIREALRHAREVGAGRVSLHTSLAGRALYEKLGFKPRDNEMDITF